MAPKIETMNVFNVFQPGLLRGAERLPFDPRKAYFYVQHPTEGWRVYLRAACMIHELNQPYDPRRFLVVKRTEADPEKKSWEPPKGQMEGRDGLRDTHKSILQLLKENIRREVAEEAKVHYIRELNHTDLIVQAVEPDFPPNTYFQYHIFSGYAHPAQIENAMREFSWYERNPGEFQRLKADKREKDGLGWFDEGSKKLMGRWSPTIVRLYLDRFSRKGS